MNYSTKLKEHKAVLSFLSIPYAKPPIVSLRFRSPEPVISWNTTLDGTKLSNICFQGNERLSNNSLVESEDCLYLNVRVPYHVFYNAVVMKNDSAKVPILV